MSVEDLQLTEERSGSTLETCIICLRTVIAYRCGTCVDCYFPARAFVRRKLRDFNRAMVNDFHEENMEEMRARRRNFVRMCAGVHFPDVNPDDLFPLVDECEDQEAEAGYRCSSDKEASGVSRMSGTRTDNEHISGTRAHNEQKDKDQGQPESGGGGCTRCAGGDLIPSECL